MKNGITLSQIAAIIGCSNTDSEKMVFGACVDSRLLKEGDLFFACSGNRTDGHQFIKQAAAKGAGAAVVSKKYTGDNFGLSLFYVDHPEQALQKLAKIMLESSKAKVVGITGSMGKTTTKDFLTHLLKSRFNVAATPENYNSQIGLPLTILNHLEKNTEVVVLEMGMTKSGHIASLVEIAPPDIAIITATALAHAENFASLAEIGLAKAEILSHPKTRLGIVHGQISNFDEIVKVAKCPVTSFCYGEDHFDWKLSPSESNLQLSQHGRKIMEFPCPSFPGEHNRHNLLAALVAAYECGVDLEELQKSLQTLTLPKWRFQIEEHDGIIYINDAYNATPAAVKAALLSMQSPKGRGRKVAVLSEMRELGGFAIQSHHEIGECSLKHVDRMFCLGQGCEPIYDLWKKQGREVFWTLNYAELLAQLRLILSPGDVVLIKGSRLSGFSEMIPKLTCR